MSDSKPLKYCGSFSYDGITGFTIECKLFDGSGGA